MATIRLSGRKPAPPRRRTEPLVRFRRSETTRQATARATVPGTVRNSRSTSIAEFFGPLTLVGGIVLGTAILLGAIFIWAFILGRTFLVTSLSVNNPTILSQEDIQKVFYELEDKRIAFFIPGNHILFLSRAALSEAFTQEYPFVEGVSHFDRHWPHSVSFSIREKNAVFLWSAADGRKFLIGGDGIVLGQYTGTGIPSGLAVLETKSTDVPQVGQKLADSKLLDRILDIQKSWPSDWSYKPVTYTIVTDQADGELIVKTSEDWVVKASGQPSGQTDINNLRVILENEIKDEATRKQLVYIDVRLQNRAFYCLKNQPCSK
jgi:hypothetical protein